MRRMATTIIVMLLVMIPQIVFIPTASAMTAGEVVWYLGDDQAIGFNHPELHVFDKIMNKDTEGTAERVLTLDAGDTAW